MTRPYIRCIQQNGNAEPSEWMRAVYQHRDWIEACVRRLHEGVPYVAVNCGFTTAKLMGVTYDDLLDRAYRHLCDVWLPRHGWKDPVL